MCKICDDPDDLVIDHCHTTGRVRGILCRTCNGGLGFFKDNIKALAGAVLYLSNNNNQQTETT